MNYWRAELRDWLAETGATDTERLVFLVLALHANGDRTARPAVRTLTAETGLGRSTVFRALGELVAGGALEAETAAGVPTAYRLDVDPSHWWTRPAPGPVPLAHKTRPKNRKTRPAPGPKEGIEGIEGTAIAENGSERVSDHLPLDVVELGFAGVENGRKELERARHGARE